MSQTSAMQMHDG